MKLKRYGKKAMIEALKNGYYICFYEWFTLNAGYKVINKDRDIIGYITFDLWLKLKQENIITTYVKEYSTEIFGLYMEV